MITFDFISVEHDLALESASTRAAKALVLLEDEDISIVFCDDHYIQNLNKQYRGIDKVTDVLSFPSDDIDPESGKRYLGDIIISSPRARQQASDAGHPLVSEVSMLVIHGVLHLLGYDHATPEEKEAMWQKQTGALKSIGINIKRFSGDE